MRCMEIRRRALSLSRSREYRLTLPWRGSLHSEESSSEESNKLISSVDRIRYIRYPVMDSKGGRLVLNMDKHVYSDIYPPIHHLSPNYGT